MRLGKSYRKYLAQVIAAKCRSIVSKITFFFIKNRKTRLLNHGTGNAVISFFTTVKRIQCVCGKAKVYKSEGRQFDSTSRPPHWHHFSFVFLATANGYKWHQCSHVTVPRLQVYFPKCQTINFTNQGFDTRVPSDVCNSRKQR